MASGAALALACAPAWAQKAAADTNDDADDTIIVTGTKVGSDVQNTLQSVTVLCPEDSVGLVQTFDAFTRVPNVTIVRDGVLPSVRGLDGNGTAQGGGGAVTGSNPRLTSSPRVRTQALPHPNGQTSKGRVPRTRYRCSDCGGPSAAQTYSSQASRHRASAFVG
jgi:hypothetical protein